MWQKPDIESFPHGTTWGGGLWAPPYCSLSFLKKFNCSGSLFAAHWLSLVATEVFSCPEAYGILGPIPGVEPTFSALEGRFLTTGQSGRFPVHDL